MSSFAVCSSCQIHVPRFPLLGKSFHSTLMILTNAFFFLLRNTENETSSSASTSDQNRHPFENVDQHLFTLPQGYGQFAFGIFDDGFEIPFGSNVQSEDNRDSENRRERKEREHQSRHRYGARQPRARLATRRAAGRHEGVPTLEGIIQQLVNGIIAPTTIPNLGLGPWGVLHSNPMDYAWGANGLDAIITQLLNQFENTGPPPADKEKIQALPTVQITQEHVDSGLECPVCKEDYTVGENVRQLPCNHLFHNSCIVPWLEQVSAFCVDLLGFVALRCFLVVLFCSVNVFYTPVMKPEQEQECNLSLFLENCSCIVYNPVSLISSFFICLLSIA
uniref:RING-type E3 ubiquitin transferase n=1 Tax=Chrysolophus pictus TaxID=9089 RepID=A0A8C3LLF6_CHRPC